jgi:alkylation response protein AidB-like acyl-CoA dehydrogenase
MDFSITDEQQQFADTFEKFCQERIAPRSTATDQAGELNKQNWADLKEMGFFGLTLPEALGGSAADWVMRSMAEESLAKACASTFLSAGASVGLCGGPIEHFGTDAQKERWLKGLGSGDLIGCFGLTEPGVGSDVVNIKTRARRVGSSADGGWVLSGEKALITNAPIADVATVMAVTDPEASYGGVTTFIVDLSKEGVTRSAPYRKMGLRGSPTGGLMFEDVKLSDDDVVGEVGQGFVQAMMTLEHGRIGMASFGIGIAEAAMVEAMKYSNERTAFGKPISRFQAVHFKIADMKVDIDAARLMARRVAWMKSTGAECRELASIAKLFATEVAVRVTDAAVQIHGGWGYTDDFIVERLYRDARLGPIGEGTSEIQRELIARSILDGD